MIGELLTNESVDSKGGRTLKVRRCVQELDNLVWYTVNGNDRRFTCDRNVWDEWRKTSLVGVKT